MHEDMDDKSFDVFGRFYSYLITLYTNCLLYVPADRDSCLKFVQAIDLSVQLACKQQLEDHSFDWRKLFDQPGGSEAVFFYRSDPKSIDDAPDRIYPIQLSDTDVVDRVFIFRCFGAEFGINIQQNREFSLSNACCQVRTQYEVPPHHGSA